MLHGLDECARRRGVRVAPRMSNNPLLLRLELLRGSKRCKRCESKGGRGGDKGVADAQCVSQANLTVFFIGQS